MNRARQHIYLVMREQVCKKSKREVQRILASKNMPVSKSINALVKALNKAETENINNIVKIITESWR